MVVIKLLSNIDLQTFKREELTPMHIPDYLRMVIFMFTCPARARVLGKLVSHVWAVRLQGRGHVFSVLILMYVIVR